MADASALVVRVDLPNLAGLHRQGVFHLSDQLARTLVEADHRQNWTVRLLVEIEKYPNVKIYESPIPQGDVAGNKFIRSKTNVAIAHHYGSPPIMTALKEDVCDGFVIGGGAARVTQHVHIAAAAD